MSDLDSQLQAWKRATERVVASPSLKRRLVDVALGGGALGWLLLLKVVLGLGVVAGAGAAGYQAVVAPSGAPALPVVAASARGDSRPEVQQPWAGEVLSGPAPSGPSPGALRPESGPAALEAVVDGGPGVAATPGAVQVVAVPVLVPVATHDGARAKAIRILGLSADARQRCGDATPLAEDDLWTDPLEVELLNLAAAGHLDEVKAVRRAIDEELAAVNPKDKSVSVFAGRLVPLEGDDFTRLRSSARLLSNGWFVQASAGLHGTLWFGGHGYEPVTRRAKSAQVGRFFVGKVWVSRTSPRGGQTLTVEVQGTSGEAPLVVVEELPCEPKSPLTAAYTSQKAGTSTTFSELLDSPRRVTVSCPGSLTQTVWSPRGSAPLVVRMWKAWPVVVTSLTGAGEKADGPARTKALPVGLPWEPTPWLRVEVEGIGRAAVQLNEMSVTARNLGPVPLSAELAHAPDAGVPAPPGATVSNRDVVLFVQGDRWVLARFGEPGR